MPFIIEEQPTFTPRVLRKRAFGAARPGALESLIYVNGLMLNDQMGSERYFVKTVDGLWGADVRDQREPKVGADGEDVYDSMLGGKTVTISGKIEALSLDSMREMEQNLESAFPHNFDYPVVFDRSQLRTRGIDAGALADNNQCACPSFESNQAGWSVAAGVTLTRDNTGFYKSSGDYYGVATWNGTATGFVEYENTSFNAIQGQYVQSSVDVFVPIGWDGGDLTLTVYVTQAGVAVQEDHLELSNISTSHELRGRWQRVWITTVCTGSPGADRVRFRLTPSVTPANGSHIFVDSAHIRASSVVQGLSETPNFFDGESPGWLWTGLPHQSTSVPDPNAYRQDVFFVARRIDKIALRDEQSNYQYNREFQVPLRMADPCIYSTTTKTVSSVPGALTTLYPKNNGSYMASPRLRITGPWTNFAIVNTVLLEGEDTQRRFSFVGSIPAGGYFDWIEDNNSLTDNLGVRRDGMVDSSANGLRLNAGTSILTLAGTGLTGTSKVDVMFEDTWK